MLLGCRKVFILLFLWECHYHKAIMRPFLKRHYAWKDTIKKPSRKHKKVLSQKFNYRCLPPMNQIKHEESIWDYGGVTF